MRIAGGITFLACLTAGAEMSADVVRLTNGDVLNGVVESADGETVVLRHPLLGTLTLPSAQVAAVEPAAGVEAAPAEAAVEPTPVAPAPATPPTPPGHAPQAEEVVPIENGLFGTGWLRGWDHALSLGFTGSSGNTDNQALNAQLKSGFQDDDDRWLIDASYYLSTKGGQRTDNEAQVAVTRDWLIPDSPWFYFANGRWEYDQFKEWENRAGAFAGLGYTWKNTERFEVNTRLGAGATYEFGSVNELTPEALFGATLVRWKLTPRQTLTASNTFFPSLGDLGEYRNVATAEYAIRIDQADGVSVKLGIEHEYESEPEDEDKHYDLKYYGALVFDF